MSGSASRMNAINAVTSFESAPAPLNFAETSAGELFGCNVFSQKVMKDRLPKSIYKSVLKTIEMGEPLAADVADTVAATVRVALGVAWATLVASELIAAQQGLGAMIQNASAFFQLDIIYVGIICIGLIAMLMDLALRAATRRLVAWQDRIA